MRLYRLTIEPSPWAKGPWIVDKKFQKKLKEEKVNKHAGCLFFSNSVDMFSEWIDWLPQGKKYKVYLWEFYLPGCRFKKDGFLEYILPVEVVKANVKRVRLVEIIYVSKRILRKMRKKNRRKEEL